MPSQALRMNKSMPPCKLTILHCINKPHDFVISSFTVEEFVELQFDNLRTKAPNNSYKWFNVI